VRRVTIAPEFEGAPSCPYCGKKGPMATGGLVGFEGIGPGMTHVVIQCQFCGRSTRYESKDRPKA